MTSKHTTGPWKCDGLDIMAYAEDPFGHTIAYIQPSLPQFQAEVIANARLIAAAPDLLEALEGLLAVAVEVGELPPDFGQTRAARAALAKAKGEL
jgi:hypothetical protein